MGHDNHNHHVDDLSGFSLFRVIWPAALLILLVFVTRNFGPSACCAETECCAKSECSKDASCDKSKGEHHEEAPKEDAHAAH